MDMPRSTLSVFSEPDDFQAALKEGGCVDLIVSGYGKFRVRLSRITLHRMRLAAGEERQSRVAFISLPPRFVRVTLPMGPPGSLVSSGIATQPNEVVMHSTGHRFHERTNGPCRWGTMWILANDLVASGYAMNGTAFALPSGECRWQPSSRALRSLVGLHRNAIRATAAHPGLPVDDQAARGLEQQLLGALMECLAGKPIDQGNPTRRRQGEIMIRFEDAIRTLPSATPSLDEVRAALGVSESTLRTCCHAYLGVGPSRYLYLRRMRLANRALRDADDTETSVGQIAKLYGFNDRGGFPKTYRNLFGELPAATLRRRTGQ
jgi:AraC-like DNA-binding protein